MSALHVLPVPQGISPGASPAGQNTVNKPLTPKRRPRLVENGEYAAFVQRILRAYARRVADGDIEAMLTMTEVAAEFDALIEQAAQGLHCYGYSWAEIGSRLGITRQAVQQHWGHTA